MLDSSGLPPGVRSSSTRYVLAVRANIPTALEGKTPADRRKSVAGRRDNGEGRGGLPQVRSLGACVDVDYREHGAVFACLLAPLRPVAELVS